MTVRWAIFLLASGCGYTMAQAERVPYGMRRLYVNQAMDAGLDVGSAATVTRILRDRIGGSNAASLVALPEAEGVVEARIDSTVDQTAIGASPTPANVPSAFSPGFQVTMRGTVRIIDQTGRVIWNSSQAIAIEKYLAGNASAQCGPQGCGQGPKEAVLSVTESNRRLALQRAAEQLGNDLYTLLVEGF